MSVGGVELLFILLIVAAFVVTVVGGIAAYRNQDGGWLAGIIIGWFFGLGWLVAVIYLATHGTSAK
jgi:hypothetical protein